jgi:hypothetical protein
MDLAASCAAVHLHEQLPSHLDQDSCLEDWKQKGVIAHVTCHIWQVLVICHTSQVLAFKAGDGQGLHGSWVQALLQVTPHSRRRVSLH